MSININLILIHSSPSPRNYHHNSGKKRLISNFLIKGGGKVVFVTEYNDSGKPRVRCL